MEDIILRFPQLSKQIFANLDNQNLVKCRTVSQSWNDSIEERKYFWLRKIQKIGQNIPDFDINDGKWRKSLRRATVHSVEELASVIQERISRGNLHLISGQSPLHHAARSKDFSVFEEFFQNAEEKNPITEKNYCIFLPKIKQNKIYDKF